MEFWGVEVKPGQCVKVDPMEGFKAYIHISQVALGEASKKDKSNDPALLYLKAGKQKIVLGSLNRDDFPHLSLDLVLDKEFELSHSSKNASVYFCGYRVDDELVLCRTSEDAPFGSSEDFSESDEEVPLAVQDNGKPEIKAEKEKVTEAKKATAGASAKLVKIAPPKKREEDDSDDESDDDDDDESGDEDEIGSPDEMDADGDSDEESDSDEDDEETPAKKVDQGKKRPNESASKTPVSAKKAKNATPEQTEGKKNVHTATPHPMKKGAKTPNSAAKTPNSGGQLSCKSCNKAFNNESGLQQHKKAKHGGQ